MNLNTLHLESSKAASEMVNDNGYGWYHFDKRACYEVEMRRRLYRVSICHPQLERLRSELVKFIVDVCAVHDPLSLQIELSYEMYVQTIACWNALLLLRYSKREGIDVDGLERFVRLYLKHIDKQVQCSYAYKQLCEL